MAAADCCGFKSYGDFWSSDAQWLRRSKTCFTWFFDALRAELYRDKISITIICPGFIQTNISINAVTGNGSEQGTMDDATLNGMPPDVFARKMLKAIEQKKNQTVIGGREIMAVYLKRFFPGLLAKVVRKAKVV
jgi:short-subunit dehydrogenase